MVEKKVKFMSAGQIMTFCNTCQKLKSDVDVTDMANRIISSMVNPLWG